MEIFYLVGIGIFGLIVGSFINAAVYRLRERELKSLLFGRSICRLCKRQLAWRDLIPLVSYLIQRGRCRFCHRKFGVRYFLVELITLLAFVGLALRQGLENPALLAWQLFFTAVLIFIAYYDYLYHEIPDAVSLPAVTFALIGAAWFFPPGLVSALLGLGLGGGLFLFLILVSQGKWLGGGDLRLAALMGLLLGWQGFLLALFLASLAGSIVGGVLIQQKILSKKSQLPFGPFLALGTYLTLLFGPAFWSWYLGTYWF
jgi:leader peptidase (prepilin peptidase)/N-methyltransferase